MRGGSSGPSTCNPFKSDTPYIWFQGRPNYNIVEYNTTGCQDGTDIFTFGDIMVCHALQELPGYVPTGGGSKQCPSLIGDRHLSLRPGHRGCQNM